MKEKSKITPEIAVALMEIAKDLTLASSTDKTGFYVPGAERHAAKGFDITKAFSGCAEQVQNSYLSLLSAAQDIDKTCES